MSSLPFDPVLSPELLRRPDEEAEREFNAFAVRIMAAATRQDPDVFHSALPTALPWVRFLSPPEAHRFATEFTATVVAAATLGDPAPVSQLVAAWRHNAEAYPEPDLHRLLAGESFDG